MANRTTSHTDTGMMLKKAFFLRPVCFATLIIACSKGPEVESRDKENTSNTKQSESVTYKYNDNELFTIGGKDDSYGRVNVKPLSETTINGQKRVFRNSPVDEISMQKYDKCLDYIAQEAKNLFLSKNIKSFNITLPDEFYEYDSPKEVSVEKDEDGIKIIFELWQPWSSEVKPVKVSVPSSSLN